jgi:hypothetical protein
MAMQPDFVIPIADERQLLVEVKRRVSAARNLRAGLLDLAYELRNRKKDSAVLILEDPEITSPRLREEWQSAVGALATPITDRLCLVVKRKGAELLVFGTLPVRPEVLVRETHQPAAASKGHRLGKADYELEIMKVLTTRYFSAAGPITAQRLGKLVGCTYPTTAKTLRKFAKWIERSRQQGIEISRLSAEQWSALVRRSDDRRPRFSFVDRSGRPRPPSTLVKKLQQLDRNDLAIGGVIGARQYKADIDLVGTPRLDICIHCPGPLVDLDFIRALDAGLAPAGETDLLPHVVVHVVRRKEAIFTTAYDGTWNADPTECLLDLHEARLEAQAAELFSHLVSTARKAREQRFAA